MKNILAIESSAGLCSLALSVGDKIYSREQQGQRSHTQFMLSFVDELLTEAKLSLEELDAIAFSAGPGSFTGIRLAASTAKALAFAANIPVISVSSLAVLAQGFYRQNQHRQAITVITDARMDELYVGYYTFSDEIACASKADELVKVVHAEQLSIACTIVGDAEILLKPLDHFSAAAFSVIAAHAIDMIPLALNQLQQGNISTAMEAEAIYLRGKGGWKTTAEQLADKKNKS
ncbi:MAG: tRNA (adenosine(37)-N6)-threonylcarbamoyltransferase complex dimerization subunit type 1 TsaB [Pseudomonadales bacterium]|nr:tRNA (adenosine(37)-N6)-threonylcarbamoyltransferase complex dimerization subunit type 1 TsaB [Pseudomonadales bacterium]